MMDYVERITFEFVDYMPSDLAQATLYVSIRYRTTAHLCCCGCGDKVVNPLRPHQWSLAFDGETTSLSPSIGNNGLRCKSHYWITRSQVLWGSEMNAEQTARALRRDGWPTVPASSTSQLIVGHRPAGLKRWLRRV